MDIHESVWIHMPLHVWNLKEVIRVLGAVVTGVCGICDYNAGVSNYALIRMIVQTIVVFLGHLSSPFLLLLLFCLN